MEDHRDTVDDRQPSQGILELVSQLGPLEHSLRLNRVRVVPPVFLDGLDIELVVVAAGAVDDPIDETAP